MKQLVSCGDLLSVNLSGNHIETIEGISHSHLEELDLSYNSIETVKSSALPSSLKRLRLKKNSLSAAGFLSKLQELDHLNIEENEFETLETLPLLSQLTELYAADNALIMVGTDQEFSDLLPLLAVLDISGNNFYDRFELVALGALQNLEELDFRGNPFCSYPSFTEDALADYPQIHILNGQQVRVPPEMPVAEYSLYREPLLTNRSPLDELAIQREAKDGKDRAEAQMKKCADIIKNIEQALNKTLRSEYFIAEMTSEPLETIEEEDQTQRNQMTPHKDTRGHTAAPALKSSPKHRKRLDAARQWTNRQRTLQSANSRVL